MFRIRFSFIYLIPVPFLLFGCGGSSDNQSTSDIAVEWQFDNFPAESSFKDFCQSPREGSFPDKSGTSMHEKMWLRSWSNNSYLWYDEVNDVDPTPFSTFQYFDMLRTTEKDLFTGQNKDKFHFAISTDEWLKQSQAGISLGYGMKFKIIDREIPRKIVVSYVEPDGAADKLKVVRGDLVTQVNGIDIVNSSTWEFVSSSLFPNDDSTSFELSFQHVESNQTKTLTMSPSESVSKPVLNVKTINTGDTKVGYFQFNSHNSPSEKALLDAISQLKAERIDDLIVDLRYNGGGLLAVSSQLAYMVAGTKSQNKTFEKLQFNDKYPNTNPITGDKITPFPFFDETFGFSDGLDSGEPLPTLNLSRVFVLTTSNTCSASEAFMNGLRGIAVDVIQIGDKTCGKPYGFYAQDNCGTTYFNVQFKGVNDKGFGDYSSGFEPNQASPITGYQIEGCLAEDDFANELGDPNEAMLETALEYRQTQKCPTLTASSISNIKKYRKEVALASEDPDGFIKNILQNKLYNID